MADLTAAQSVARLEAALARGELSVDYGGRSVRYRDVSELKEALAYFKAKMSAESGARPVTVSIGSVFR